ncbi:MAG: coproporphyrinogen dehydrogenase HemZ [Clostridia bacterium]|nr:coproporphyrinogen dehydrogenase HemZ [Clostridia bacterium]
MKLCLINHSFKYELEKLIRIFLPFEKIEFFDTFISEDNVVVTEIKGNKAKASLYLNNELFKYEILLNSFDEKNKELKLATALFNCFCEATGYISQWGLLTGVRPAKLWSRLKDSMGETNAERYFKEELLVSDKKVSLCKKTNLGEDTIIGLSKPNSYSLYISIPFCPTRCSYCSFVSHSIDKAKKLIPEYVNKLCEEIIITSKIAKKNNLKLETVYIGGGTPTAIDEYNLERIMKTVSENFDLSNIREYTVEAGRPDTITAQKLTVIKNNGATRISINPQTMNDSVLETIGRKHTEKQTVDSFKLARSLGFDNINMDLIAGLPTDNIESFKTTIDKVLKLNPESVTVHSLSFKRSSNLNFDDNIKSRNIDAEASLMVDFALETLTENGILPYYMYRQSKTVGNLENVGYAKKGFECLYNVYIMDETHSILACGASSVSKLREPGGNFIDRIFNFKYPYEYIDRFDEIIARKDGINDFYNKYGI